MAVATAATVYMLRLSFAMDESLSCVLESRPRRYRPVSFLLNLINRRGSGSLNTYLKEKGWAVGVATGTDGFEKSFDTLDVEIRLTEVGFSEWRYSPCNAILTHGA